MDFDKCFTATPKESEFALDSFIFFVEDYASFLKQFSDRRSAQRFGRIDAPLLTKKDENRKILYLGLLLNPKS